MLLGGLSKMSRKTPSLDSNSRAEAKRQDDWWFHEEPSLNNEESIMTKWKKKVKNILSTPIPGHIVTGSLTGLLLGITGALFIVLPVTPQRSNTLEESISFKNESLEILLIVEGGGELQVKATGATTMEVLTNLRQMLPSMGETLLLEKSYPYTPHQGV